MRCAGALARLAGLWLLTLPSAAWAAATLPPWLPLMPALKLAEVSADERWGEAVVPTPQQPQHLVRGRHWAASLKFSGADETGPAMWSRWKPALQQAGWQAVDERPVNPYAVSVRLTQPGREAWARIQLFGADDIRLDLVEVGENRLRLTVPPPASRPETVKPESGAFPYLPPPPGAQLTGGERDDRPMLVTLPGAGGETRLQVASGSLTKVYRSPRDLSNLDFAHAYRDALLAGGWTLPRLSQGPNASDTLLVAHYGRNGRNLWAVLHHAPGEMSLQVGDAGQQDLAQALKKDCRVTLLGVLFDFDKATLKAESDAVLARAREAIVANPGLALEVQGHTDAVGQDGYNQKLSEARAQSVMAWLTAKGVPPAQLGAKGYGKSQPVASNDSDDGRARNRRVDLACRK